LDNLKDAEPKPTTIDRVLHGHSPFAPWHRHSNHFNIPYKFPSFQIDGFHDPSHNFGLKFEGGNSHGSTGNGGGGGYDYTPGLYYQ
jgi:hypothetical protein